MKKVYEETRTTVKTRKGLTNIFETRKSVRQDVMNPALFNLYIADLDKDMEKRGIRGITLGKRGITL